MRIREYLRVEEVRIDLSFKPEELHPLAGMAIPTMVGVMLEETDDAIELFGVLERTHRIVEGTAIATAVIGGVLGVLTILAGAPLPMTVVTLEFGILTLALTICQMHISGTKWWVFDRAKAYHEAATKIVEEFYSVEL